MAEFRASMEEKDRSVAMFDKRLSQRFRNSFPRRTNSYINRPNFGLGDRSAAEGRGGEGAVAGQSERLPGSPKPNPDQKDWPVCS